MTHGRFQLGNRSLSLALAWLLCLRSRSASDKKQTCEWDKSHLHEMASWFLLPNFADRSKADVVISPCSGEAILFGRSADTVNRELRTISRCCLPPGSRRGFPSAASDADSRNRGEDCLRSRRDHSSKPGTRCRVGVAMKIPSCMDGSCAGMLETISPRSPGKSAIWHFPRMKRPVRTRTLTESKTRHRVPGFDGASRWDECAEPQPAMGRF